MFSSACLKNLSLVVSTAVNVEMLIFPCVRLQSLALAIFLNLKQQWLLAFRSSAHTLLSTIMQKYDQELNKLQSNIYVHLKKNYISRKETKNKGLNWFTLHRKLLQHKLSNRTNLGCQSSIVSLAAWPAGLDVGVVSSGVLLRVVHAGTSVLTARAAPEPQPVKLVRSVVKVGPQAKAALEAACGWRPKDTGINFPTVTGFIQKNPFKIHKIFTNLCNMARKSNTKVQNSSAHPVKGCNA